MAVSNNITIRRIRKHNSLLDLSAINTAIGDTTGHSSQLDTSFRSLCNISIGCNQQIMEHKKEIERLANELDIANVEIDNLSIQNAELTKKTQLYESKLKIYKSLGIDDLQHSNNPSPNRSKTNSQHCSSNSTPKYAGKFLQHSIHARIPQIGIPQVLPRQLTQQIPQQIRMSQEHTGITTQHKNRGIVTFSVSTNTGHDMATIIIDETKEKEIAQKKVLNVESRASIYIVGSEQLKDLSASMLFERKSKWNDKYDLFGDIKSGATSRHIITSINTLENKLTQKDRVILCLGENDSNPTELMASLSIALNKLKNATVYVVQVNSNRHLNIKLINNNIMTICRYFKNCNYVSIGHTFTNRNEYLHRMSGRLNLMIDSIDYDSQFLNFASAKSLRYSMSSNKKNSFTKLKKGTIPYYFRNHKQTQTQTDFDVISSTQVGDINITASNSQTYASATENRNHSSSTRLFRN